MIFTNKNLGDNKVSTEYGIIKQEENPDDPLHRFCFYRHWKGKKNETIDKYYYNTHISVKGFTTVDSKTNKSRQINAYYQDDYKKLMKLVPVLGKVLELICGQGVTSFGFSNEFFEIYFVYDQSMQTGKLGIIYVK